MPIKEWISLVTNFHSFETIFKRINTLVQVIVNYIVLWKWFDLEVNWAIYCPVVKALQVSWYLAVKNTQERSWLAGVDIKWLSYFPNHHSSCFVQYLTPDFTFCLSAIYFSPSFLYDGTDKNKMTLSFCLSLLFKRYWMSCLNRWTLTLSGLLHSWTRATLSAPLTQ